MSFADGEFSDQACETYEVRRARQMKLDEDRAMHDKIINLCGQPGFDRAIDDLKKQFSAFGDGFMLNPRGAMDRIHHNLLSTEVYNIVNYPKLGSVLEECYPGSKFSQFTFIYLLKKNDREAIWDAAAGVAVQAGIFKGGAALVTKFIGTARALSIYKWLFVPTTVGVYELFQWSNVPHNQSSGNPTRVDQPNTSDPIIERIDAAKNNASARDKNPGQQMGAISLMPNLFEEKMATLNTDLTNDVNSDIVNYLRSKANVCLSSVSNYLRAKSVGFGKTLQPSVRANCRNYVTEARDGLERLRDKRYACLPANRNATSKVLADLDLFLQVFPIELIEDLK